MNDTLWAIVLAAGDGTRLASLTRSDSGDVVPKQYCSLRGGRSLLLDATARAGRFVPPSRTCVVVAEAHRVFWESTLAATSPANVIAQPLNRGTAIGVLLALLTLWSRQPEATLLFLPADHHVADEETLIRGMASMLRVVDSDPDSLVLLGIEPDEADGDLGYLLPVTDGTNGGRRVERFVEKPSVEEASRLIGSGAIWNSFIFAVRASCLLGILERRIPVVCERLRWALARNLRRSRLLDEVYAGLPVVDFSRDILQEAIADLRVVVAASCGWTDLGTPQRVARTLASTRSTPFLPTTRSTPRSFLSLALQQARRTIDA